MLRTIIPAFLVFTSLTLYAESDTSLRTSTIIFEVPGKNGKPSGINKEEKAHTESCLKNFLEEMTITPSSVSWTEKHEMKVVLPAMGEIVRQTVVKKLTQETFLERGQLRLHHVHPENQKTIAQLEAEGKENRRVPGYILKTMVTKDEDEEQVNEKILIREKPILDSSVIEHAQELYGPHEGKLNVKLNAEGAKKMFAATNKMRHGVDRIAIILDGKVLSAPVVQSALHANFEISGMANAAEAKKIATALLSPVSKSLTLKSINPPLAK